MAQSVARAPAPARRWLVRLAWLLLAVSLVVPAPSGSGVVEPLGISSLYLYDTATAWSAATPGLAGSLSLAQVAIVSLALYSNIVFLYAAYLRDDRAVSISWKAFVCVALVVDVLAAFLVPEFAHLPAFWVWVAAVATLALSYVVFGSSGSGADAKASRGAEAEIDRGEIPKFAWVLLGFTIFWIAVSAISRIAPADAAARASRDSLTSYVNDRAHVLSGYEVQRLTLSLQNFEATTPSQIAVAIYPRAPGGAIDEFTIRTAEAFPLGRAGLDTGAILFVFMEDKAARLEVGYGLEGTLTDAIAHRTLESELAPSFARGAYFDGLDATLNAIFGIVRNTYQQNLVPGRSTTWRRKLTSTRPTKSERMWRAISEASLLARIGSALLGTLVLLALWATVWQRSRLARAVGRSAAAGAAATDWGRFIRDIGRGIGNLRARRAWSDGMERFEFSTIVDTVRLVLWVAALLVPTAAVVIIAGGGEFGGAGSLIHW